MTPNEIRTSRGHILHDADVAPNIRDDHFEPSWWLSHGRVVGEARGRCSVYFVQHENETWALRHYCRGGWVARLSRDRYVWLGPQRTRMSREWHMLSELCSRGLPVPKPIAIRVQRAGLFYQGQILTRLIRETKTVADAICERPLAESEWRAIGALLAEFQQHGVRHDDINVRNVLIGRNGRLSLIDFDKAKFALPGAWRQRNLARFLRSIEKLRRQRPDAHFETGDWLALMDGYDSSIARGPQVVPPRDPVMGAKRSKMIGCTLGCHFGLELARDFWALAAI